MLAKESCDLLCDLLKERDGAPVVARVLADPFNTVAAKAVTAVASTVVETNLRQPHRDSAQQESVTGAPAGRRVETSLRLPHRAYRVALAEELADRFNRVAGPVVNAALVSGRVETSLRQWRRDRVRLENVNGAEAGPFNKIEAEELADRFGRAAVEAMTAVLAGAPGKVVAQAITRVVTEVRVGANLHPAHRDRARRDRVRRERVRPRPVSIAGSGLRGGRDESGAGRTGAAFCRRAFGYGDC